MVGKWFWSAITSAALARAAVQLARLTALDSADLCPEGVLALHTARERTAIQKPVATAAASLQLFVRALDGATISLQLPATAGVAALRAAVVSRTGIPAEECRLIFAGKTLQQEQSLESLGICSGMELQLRLSLKGGAANHFDRTFAQVSTDAGMGITTPQPSPSAARPRSARAKRFPGMQLSQQAPPRVV